MNSLGRRLAVSSSRTTRSSRRCALTGPTRSVHSRRGLPYPIENGLGDFLPPDAVRTIAVDWQEGLLNRLNDEVKGTRYQNQSVVQTVIDTAPDPSKTLAFTYASQALNNSFFLDNLKPPPPAPATDHENDIGSSLAISIRSHFGSLSQLKSHVSASAMGMSSSGWVWLVMDKEGRLGVLPTFGSGTLLVRSRQQTGAGEPLVAGEEPLPSLTDYPRARWGDRESPSRSQNRSPSPPLPTSEGGVKPTSPTSGMNSPLGSLHPSVPSRTLHVSAPRNDYGDFDLGDRPNSLFNFQGTSLAASPPNPNTVGEDLFPLFCVSVHEHAWISAGYGVWGKEEYLKRFWTALDWMKVTNSYKKNLGHDGP